MLACIFVTIGRLNLSVGPSSPPASEKSLANMANFWTRAALLVDFSFALLIPFLTNKKYLKMSKTKIYAFQKYSNHFRLPCILMGLYCHKFVILWLHWNRSSSSRKCIHRLARLKAPSCLDLFCSIYQTRTSILILKVWY